MKVILQKPVDKLGAPGDIVETLLAGQVLLGVAHASATQAL